MPCFPTILNKIQNSKFRERTGFRILTQRNSYMTVSKMVSVFSLVGLILNQRRSYMTNHFINDKVCTVSDEFSSASVSFRPRFNREIPHLLPWSSLSDSSWAAQVLVEFGIHVSKGQLKQLWLSFNILFKFLPEKLDCDIFGGQELILLNFEWCYSFFFNFYYYVLWCIRIYPRTKDYVKPKKGMPCFYWTHHTELLASLSFDFK